MPQRRIGRSLLGIGAIAILLGILTADAALLFWCFTPVRSLVTLYLFLSSMALCLGGMLCLWLGGRMRPPEP